MTQIELVATIAGFLCVFLYIKQNILSWPIGLVQVILYIFIFYEAKLYSDMILHIIYVGLQIYGWYHWVTGEQHNNKLPVTTLPWSWIVIYSMLCCVGTLLVGLIMTRYTDASLPYADAMIMVTSLVAQWLIARKILQTWYFWIVVDVVAITVFFQKGLFFTTVLYGLFLIMATIGLLAWRRSFLGTKLAPVTG